MPAQLSTILYISDYKEKISSGYTVANAIGYTRLNSSDLMQKYAITAFIRSIIQNHAICRKLKKDKFYQFLTQNSLKEPMENSK